MLTSKGAASRHADLLVRGGTVVRLEGSEQADIACVDGRIVSIDAGG
ncbi:dihydroorotase-like cyclic amidohydrolase [Paraburkholderia sp. MM5477-R1]